MRSSLAEEIASLKTEFAELKVSFERRISALELRQSLEAIAKDSKRISAKSIAGKAAEVPSHRQQRKLAILDRDRNIIRLHDRVFILTKGKYTSTEGTVYKISKRGDRVTLRDSNGESISRAHRNLRVILK